MMTKMGDRHPVAIKTSLGGVPVAHILTDPCTAGISRETYFRLLDDVG